MKVKLIEREDPRLSVPQWRTDRFRELRKLTGFSLKEMAVFLGLSYSKVRHYSSGKNFVIPPDTLRLLAYDVAVMRGELSESK